MSDIRFNQWLHNSGTGGVSQVDGGHVGIGTTNPLIPVGAGVTAVLNVGVVTANYYYGDGSNLSGVQVGGASSLSLNDNIGAYFGNSQDLKIYHDGNHSYVDDQGTGNLRLRSGTLEIQNLAGNKTSAIFSSGGAQTLNFNNSPKFATQTNGITVTGGVYSDGLICGDSDQIELGDSGDLSIYHNGSNGYIKNSTGQQLYRSATHTFENAAGNSEYLRIDPDGRLLVGTTNTSNGHVAASKATVHGHLNIFKDSEGDNAGVNSHQLKFVTQSGSIAEIMATSAGAGGPSGRGGYLSFFAKPNNNSTLKETMRVSPDYVLILRENTGNEGGQIGLARSSDNTAYWFIDSYGSSNTPDFRLHAGGTSHFSINASGQWVDAPTGTIINVGYARYDPNNDSYAVISQDTRAASAVYLDFTPRRADSKLIIMTRMHTRMIAANGCSYGIEQSTNSGGSYSDLDGMNQRNAMDFFYKGDGVNHHYTGFCMRQIDSYTGSRRFRPWGQGWGGGTWEVSYGHGEHSVTIYEVAV